MDRQILAQHRRALLTAIITYLVIGVTSFVAAGSVYLLYRDSTLGLLILAGGAALNVLARLTLLPMQPRNEHNVRSNQESGTRK
jgi:hypothetical protein